MRGWSELIFGSMYCGKSEELIRRLKRVKIAGKKFQLFKPCIDNRYSADQVATHDNNETKKQIEDVLANRFNKHIIMFEENLKNEVSNEIMKHVSGSMKAIPVKNSVELLNNVDENAEVIGIDEVQFFDEGLIQVVKELTKMGKRVICAGLDMYASEEPFGIVPTLACQAKYVTKLHAVCVDCGEDAYISYKVSDNESNTTSKVDVGSVNKYVALCEKCSEIRNKKEQQNG